jgi:hypothetical protein
MSNEVDLLEALMVHTNSIPLLPALPIEFPDIPVPLDIGDGVKLSCVHLANINGSPSWGADKIMQGIWQVSVVVADASAIGPGAIPPTHIASIIAEHFKKNTKLFRGACRVVVYQNPTILTPITEPSKTTYPVSIPYRVFLRE